LSFYLPEKALLNIYSRLIVDVGAAECGFENYIEQGGCDMSRMVISNPADDPEAATLVNKTYETISQHWRDVIPELTITISGKPFNQAPGLQDFCKAQKEKKSIRAFDWESIYVACPEIEPTKATLWAYYDRRPGVPNEYEFQKQLFQVIGSVIWATSKRVQDEARRNATGTAACSPGAAYLAFRDTFSRFFLNPDYLRERKEDAWDFITGIDRALATRA
jgi:hypothetical protein